MKKIRAVRQRDSTDCGAACLASVLGYHGCHLPVSRIRQLACTDKEGTNILGMIQAAEACGFIAKGVRANAQNFDKLSFPAIAHMIMPSGLHHFVVLTKPGKASVRMMDPAEGKVRKWSREQFLGSWSGVVIMMMPSPVRNAQHKRISAVSRLKELAKPHGSALVLGLLGSIAYTFLGFSMAIYLQKLLDNVIEQENTGLLHVLGIIMLLIVLMQTVLAVIRVLITTRTGQVMDARLITSYFRHLYYLPQRFFDTMRVGEIISRIGDAVKIRAFVAETIPGIFLNLLIVTFSFLLLFFYFWKLALVVVLFCPFFMLIYIITSRINRLWQRKLMEQAAAFETNLVEGLSTSSTIKRLNLEPYIITKTESSFYELLRSSFIVGTLNLYAGSGGELINRVLALVTLWAGAFFVMQHQLTPGELLSFYSVTAYFAGPVVALTGSGKAVQEALIATDRLFEVIDLERESTHKASGIVMKASEIGDIHFEKVCFRYGTRSRVFEELSLCFRKGQITAVVGESGSGKSTLLNLLQRLYAPDSGLIRIGNTPLQYFSMESIRAMFGVVPQQTELFSGTIAENIAIGDPSPNMASIIETCRLSGADGFIEQLPQGYFSSIGEKGSSISGGQQQKLAIARALYRNPEVLIMDEATAHLDPVSERKLQLFIRQFTASGKTVILIAHRLSTIAAADHVHVLKGGKLEGSGKHAELLVSCEHYASLWKEAGGEIG